MAYRFEGPAAATSRTPILFIHNAGNDHFIWIHQLEHFSKQRQVYALDLLGFGRSDAPEIAYDLELYTALVGAFVESLGLARVILVGNCIGASAALQYALKHPEKVESLVLFNVATGRSLRSGPVRRLEALVSASRLSGRIVEGILRGLSGFTFVHKRLQRGAYGDEPEPSDRVYRHVRALLQLPKQFETRMKLLRRLKSFDALNNFTRPAQFPRTALFWGAKNRVVSLDAGRAFAAVLNPDFQRWVAGAGHMAMNEAPHEVNTDIDEFILER